MTTPLDLWTDAATRGHPREHYTARHQRGHIRLPHDTLDAAAGQLVPAWVCCDPACSGVEAGADVLDLNHGRCQLPRFQGQKSLEQGRHMAGYGTTWFTGHYRGPLTPLWIPPTRDGGDA